MALHGVISHLLTRKPTRQELDRYHEGLLQHVELTANLPWEPYSAKFAETEEAARKAPSVSALRVTIPLTSASVHKPEEEEEDRPCSSRAPSVSALRVTIPLTSASVHKPEEEEEDRPCSSSNPQRTYIPDDRQISVASRWNRADSMIELIDDDEFLTRIVSAINVGSEFGPSEDEAVVSTAHQEPEDTTPLARVAAGLKSKERGPIITKEILARRWGIGLDTAHRTLTATTQLGVQRILHPVDRRFRTRQAHLRFPNCKYTVVYRYDVHCHQVAPRKQVRPSIHQRDWVRSVLSVEERGARIRSLKRSHQDSGSTQGTCLRRCTCRDPWTIWSCGEGISD
jgi:hypothetical protein